MSSRSKNKRPFGVTPARYRLGGGPTKTNPMPKHGGLRNNAGSKPKFRGKRYTVYLNADHCELVPGLFAEYIRGAIKARLVSDGLIQE